MQKNTGNSNRLDRINEELKKEISNIINYEVKNSKITGMLSVTKVRVSPDLSFARVYVSMLNSKNVKDTLAGLKASSGFVRKMVAQRMNLRITPELVFEFDDSLVYGDKIDKILKEIMQENKPEQ